MHRLIKKQFVNAIGALDESEEEEEEDNVWRARGRVTWDSGEVEEERETLEEEDYISFWNFEEPEDETAEHETGEDGEAAREPESDREEPEDTQNKTVTTRKGALQWKLLQSFGTAEELEAWLSSEEGKCLDGTWARGTKYKDKYYLMKCWANNKGCKCKLKVFLLGDGSVEVHKFGEHDHTMPGKSHGVHFLLRPRLNEVIMYGEKGAKKIVSLLRAAGLFDNGKIPVPDHKQLNNYVDRHKKDLLPIGMHLSRTHSALSV